MDKRRNYSTIKGRKLWYLLRHGWTPKALCLNMHESQTPNLTYVWSTQNRSIHRAESRRVGWWWGGTAYWLQGSLLGWWKHLRTPQEMTVVQHCECTPHHWIIYSQMAYFMSILPQDLKKNPSMKFTLNYPNHGCYVFPTGPTTDAPTPADLQLCESVYFLIVSWKPVLFFATGSFLIDIALPSTCWVTSDKCLSFSAS